MGKKNLAVIFGGRSSEHEISCLSAVTVINAIDRNRYDVTLVGITKDGRWLLTDSVEQIRDGSWVNGAVLAAISPDASVHGLILIRDGAAEYRPLDVVFPVLHGLNGEDGTIQGLFQLAGIPYVGCGVLSSAVCMDKFFTKIIVERLGVAQARFIPVYRQELSCLTAVLDRVEAAFSYPVFVKPSNAGSSKGVSKASDRDSLAQALRVAAAEDYKILVEEAIVGRELECAVFGGKTIETSGVGEVLAADEFYSYEAKYHNDRSRTDLSPVLPEGKEEEIRQAAAEIFRAVDGAGLSRADFFLENGTNRVVFNEINTLPGFTSISMYPMLWAKKGRELKALVEELIESAWLRERA